MSDETQRAMNDSRPPLRPPRAPVCYRLRSGVRLVAERLLFDDVWGNFHRPSDTARHLLKLLETGATADQLSVKLRGVAGSDAVRSSSEALRFLSDLLVLGLVEEMKQ